MLGFEEYLEVCTEVSESLSVRNSFGLIPLDFHLVADIELTAVLLLASFAGVESDKVHIGRESKKNDLLAFAVTSLAFVASIVRDRNRHKEPFQRNLRMLEVSMQPLLDRNKLQRMAMQSRFSDACPSFDGFGTRPEHKRKRKQINISD